MPDDVSKEENDKMPVDVTTSTPSDDEPTPQPKVETEPETKADDKPVVQPNVSGSAFEKTSEKKSKKKWLLPAIIAAVLVVLGAGGALAYNMWYQNPDKVLSDAVGNLFTAATAKTDGKLVYTPKGSAATSTLSRMTLTFTSQSDKKSGVIDATITFEASGKEYSISGSGLMAENGDLYLKVKGLNALMQQVAPTSSTSLSSVFGDFIKKIDDKWIKIEASKLKEFSKSAGDKQECFNKIQDKVKADNSLLNGVLEAYNKNKFIVVKDNLGVKDGSIGYRIDSDKDKAKAFITDVKNTELYKEYVKCDPSIADALKTDTTKATDSTDGTSTVDVWVNQWSHQFTKLSVVSNDSTSDLSLDLNMKFNQSIKVDTPSDSISLDELKAELQKAEQSYMQSYSSSYSSSYYSSANSI